MTACVGNLNLGLTIVQFYNDGAQVVKDEYTGQKVLLCVINL